MVHQATNPFGCPPDLIGNNSNKAAMAGESSSASNNNVLIVGNNGVDNNTNGNGILIRAATPADTAQVRALVQELADHQNMSTGPRIGPEQLALDMTMGAMHLLVATTDNENGGHVAAYALFYLPCSWERGVTMFLEDLYIQVPYRRKGLGIRMLRELEKIAHANQFPFMEWNVLRSNFGAIKFYQQLSGLEDMTDGEDKEPAARKIVWRLPEEAFGHVLRKATQAKMPSLEVEMVMDQPGQIAEHTAQQLAEKFHKMMLISTAGGSVEELAKQLRDGQLGVVFVSDNNKNTKPEADDGPVVAMALFHRKAYSSWTGAYLTLDEMIVHSQYRRKGIGTKMMGELVKVAQQMGAVRIQWTAAAAPTVTKNNGAFFESLNAVNLTDTEGWLLYRWHYKQNDNDAEEAKQEGR